MSETSELEVVIPLNHDGQTSQSERMISACAGALLTMSLMTPLDVVKTRLQTQEMSGVRHMNGTWDGLIKVARYEGAPALFRGLFAGLLISVPATVNYYAGYDYVREKVQESRFHGTPIDTYSPLWAGGIARAFAATFVSPLELLRTRIQAADKEGISGIWRGIMEMVKVEGLSSLWRGIVPTLLRDVPFSAVYWMAYERVRDRLGKGADVDNVSNFRSAFIAGASSGMLAALVTHPFDVIKTQRQVSSSQGEARVVDLMRYVLRVDGYQGFFKGLVPRVIKVAPSCAIMISSYEVGKRFFANRRAASISSSSL